MPSCFLACRCIVRAWFRTAPNSWLVMSVSRAADDLDLIEQRINPTTTLQDEISPNQTKDQNRPCSAPGCSGARHLDVSNLLLFRGSALRVIPVSFSVRGAETNMKCNFPHRTHVSSLSLIDVFLGVWVQCFLALSFFSF